MRLSRGTDTRPVRSLTVLDVRRRRFLRRAHHQQDRRSSRPLYRSGWICHLHGFTLELQHPRDFRVRYRCWSDSRRLCWAIVDGSRVPHAVLCDGGDKGKVVRSLLVSLFSILSGRPPRTSTEDRLPPEIRELTRFRDSNRMIFNLGGVLGSAIELGLVYNSETNTVGNSVYIVFMTIGAATVLLPITLVSPSKMVRSDGTRVIPPIHPSTLTFYHLDPALFVLQWY